MDQKENFKEIIESMSREELQSLIKEIELKKIKKREEEKIQIIEKESEKVRKIVNSKEFLLEFKDAEWYLSEQKKFFCWTFKQKNYEIEFDVVVRLDYVDGGCFLYFDKIKLSKRLKSQIDLLKIFTRGDDFCLDDGAYDLSDEKEINKIDKKYVRILKILHKIVEISQGEELSEDDYEEVIYPLKKKMEEQLKEVNTSQG